MRNQIAIRHLIAALPLFALIGCGNDDENDTADELLRGTLAYVVFECVVEPDVVSTRWELRVRKGDGEPVTVAEYEETLDPASPTALWLPGADAPAPVTQACQVLGLIRLGPASVNGGSPFQLVAVSPDGSLVAFQLTERFFADDPDRLPPEAEGIFVVRPDGSDLRRLGPASSVPSFTIDPLLTAPFAGFTFSPNGRQLVFVDQGPGPAGEDALQVWTQDVVTGKRTQVTRLPNGSPVFLPRDDDPSGRTDGPPTCCASFLDNDTIQFATTVRLDESSQSPDEPSEPRLRAAYTVETDGDQLREIPRDPIPGEAPEVANTFVITGERPSVGFLFFERPPENEFDCELTKGVIPNLAFSGYRELFYFDGDLLRQLTPFRFIRTAVGGSTLSTDGSKAFFMAAADPFGTNPSQNCQLFSIDVIGSNLRQLTRFDDVERLDDVEYSTSGCSAVSSPDCGCTIREPYQDPWTEALIFYSTCDPFGTNLYGGEIFAMRPDGTDLRQLTETQGFVDSGDGSFVVELPGPYAYSSKNPGGLH